MASGNSTNMTSQGIYSFKSEEPQLEKKKLTLRTAVCSQLFGVFLFAVGLVAGLLIGIYAFHGGPNRPKCDHVAPLAEASVQSRSHVSSKQEVPVTKKPTTRKPLHVDHGHDHSHDHGDHGGHGSHGGHGDHGHHGSHDDHVATGFQPPTDSFHDPHTTDHREQTTAKSSSQINAGGFEAPNFGSLDETQTPKPTTPVPPSTTKGECEVCTWRNPIKTLETSAAIFDPITPEEMRLVRDVLFQRKITTIKPGDTLAFNESYIQSMSLHPPNKQDVLEYLDRSGPVPGRYGWVSVVEGAANPPVYNQYKVGPLDGDAESVKIVPLLKPMECPFEYRPYDTVEVKLLIIFVMDEMYKANLILSESFDSRTPYQDLTVLPTGPLPHTDGKRISRFTLGLRGLGDRDFDFLNILPLHGKVFHGGMNQSDWYVYDIFYINQGPYQNMTELLKAYVSDEVAKIRYPKGTRKATEELTFPKRNMYVPLRENSQYPGTSAYEPTGPRYDIDGNSISWLGWSLTVATTQHKGPGVYNVKFRNERVLYENSLSDIGLIYSSDGSGQDNIAFSDATYGIGESRKAIPGVDCPEYAAYLRTTAWDPSSGKPSTKLTICVFEKDAQEPLWRHKGTHVEAGMNNRYLVVRYPTQIGNYDYIIDFEFHLDGRIVTTATATGFIQGSFWNPFNDYYEDENEKTPFGYKVSGTLIGPIHDHTFAFKVDMDIVDEKNDFELIHWKYGTVSDAFGSKSPNGKMKKFPNYFLYNQTRYITWEPVENETALDIDMINQKFWTVVNNNHKNMWNVSRGYRIMPMASGAQNILDDFPRIKEMSFTKHHLHLTKYREDEHFIKPLYNPRNTVDTEVNAKYLDDMVNGESIKNSDIVSWIAVGFLHVPTSEDVPMTTRVTSGFTLKPFNFFDTTATFDVPAHALGENDTVLDNSPRSGPCLYMPMRVSG